MTYFKSLFFNFLAVFFVNHVVPGIEIENYTKIPQIKGDLIFAFGLGFISSLVFPFLRYLHLKPSNFKIGLITLIISMGSYISVKYLSLGVELKTYTAYVWAILAVWFCSYLTNYLEFKNYLCQMELNKLKKENKEEK